MSLVQPLVTAFGVMIAVGTKPCYCAATPSGEVSVAHSLHHSGHTHNHHLNGANRRDFLSALISAAAFVPLAFGQTATLTPSETAARFRKMSEDYEKEGLAAPFKGITTNGEVISGLFEIKPSGVPTEPVRNAAENFIASLTPFQLARTMYPVDDVEWRKWMNQHFYARQGVCFGEMTDSQREAAFGLLRASLSPKGFELTRNIMRLNETFGGNVG
jgi:hypothetical protein